MTTRPKRNIYLQMKTLPEARALWRRSNLFLSLCHGNDSDRRRSRTDSRAADRCQKFRSSLSRGGHGWHCREGQSTFGASDVNPLRLVLGRSAFEVDTGDALPAETDAVIMIEQVEPAWRANGGDSRGSFSLAACAQSRRRYCRRRTAVAPATPPSTRRPWGSAGRWSAGSAGVCAPAGLDPAHRDRADFCRQSGRSGAGTDHRVQRHGALGSWSRNAVGKGLLQDIIVDDYESIKRALVEAVDSPADVDPDQRRLIGRFRRLHLIDHRRTR